MACYDVIVVGGGAAGSVVAARMAEDEGRRVLLLEAGRDWHSHEAPPELRMKAWGPAMDSSRVPDFHFPGYQARHSPVQQRTAYLRGRGLGGSTNINGQIAIRPALDDFDLWVGLGAAGWTPEVALSHFVAIESDREYGERPYHGRTGPMPVERSNPAEWTPLDSAFFEAALEVGYASCPDINAPGAQGVVPFAYTSRLGRRVTTNDAYLEPARAHANLVIIGGALVDRVVLHRGRAVGVRWIGRDGPAEAGAAEIVLCAGAIGSPAILQRSGIGPASQLRALDIDVGGDLPVGQAVHDHPWIALPFAMFEESDASEQRRSVAVGVRYTSDGEGSRPADHVLLVGNRVRPGGTAGSLMAGAKTELPSRFVVWQHESASHGRLLVTSPDPAVPPEIDLNLLSVQSDLVRMRQAVRRVSDIAARPRVAKLGTGPTVGSSGRTALELDDVDLSAILLAEVGDASHICSSCPMGSPDSPTTVVDPSGRVLGFDGLRVADASIAPKMIRANTNLTTIAMAQRIATLMESA